MSTEASLAYEEEEEILSIAEFALYCNVTKHQLRNWDEMLDPIRRDRGSRWYRREQKENVDKIKEILEKGHSLTEAQKVLRGEMVLEKAVKIQVHPENIPQDMSLTEAVMLIGNRFQDMKNELKEQSAQMGGMKNELKEIKKINFELHDKVEALNEWQETQNEKRAKKVDEALGDIRKKLDKKNESMWQRLFK